MYKWGIIGAGKIAKRFIKSLENSDRGVLYAIASLSKSDKLKEEYEDVKIYSSYTELLKDPEIDVVYIANRHKDHYLWTFRALENGKHVLCEKPATLNKKDMEKIKEASLENGKFFMEGIKTRFIPLVIELKSRLDRGDFGEVLEIKNSYCYDFGSYDKDSYLFDKNQGGVFNDLGSYSLSMCQDLIKDEILKVDSKVEYYKGIDSYNDLTITYVNGKKAHVRMALDREERRIGTIKCDKTTIEIEPFYRPEEAKITYIDGREEEIYIPYINDDFFTEIEEVHDSLDLGKLESDKLPMDDSIEIANIMDKIRKII